MAQQGVAPRRAALALLGGVTVDHKLLAELLPGPLASLNGADRARAQRLAVGCMRALDRCDRMLGPFLQKKPDPYILNILRLGTYEMCAEHAAPYGVVNDCVTLVRDSRDHVRLAGLVNAVLRRVGEAGPEAWDKLPVPRLPKWLRKVLVADFGKEAVEAMELAQSRRPPLDLTPRDGDGAGLAERMGGTLLPTGSVRLADAGQVTALHGYETGDWWVQDAAAALPARILAPLAGERVIDLCAAPGGKTMQLAAAGADVTAIDVSAFRMKRLEENLARTNLKANVITADVFEHHGDPYDAVLLDAPCTATGTIRRHPDLPQAKDGSDFPGLFELQRRMIDHAITLLRPGGRLVYCTCSLLIDEGEEQLRDALDRHPALTIDRDALRLPGIDPDWIGAEGGLRLRPDYWPDLGGMDGFYIAVFRTPA